MNTYWTEAIWLYIFFMYQTWWFRLFQTLLFRFLNHHCFALYFIPIILLFGYI